MKQRILTAIILSIICIPILIMGGTIFNLFVLAIGVIGLKEMLDIS
jgi:phosphatidate cytidylyltransferase